MRKLASIQKIVSVSKIDGADRIELARVLGWDVVIKRGEFYPGELAVYFEIDSLLPETSWSKFLFKPEDLGKGKKHRLKTVKMRGQISQGLLVPISAFCLSDVSEGRDLTELLGIEKYEPTIPAKLAGQARGNFPTHLIAKTDEDRIQSSPHLLDELRGYASYASVKCDGSSMTVLKFEGDLQVCSRNLSLKESEENSFWKMYYKYFQRVFESEDNLAIQCEVVGPGIQKNRMGLSDLEVRVFNVYDIKKREYLTLDQQLEFCSTYNLPHVPVVWRGTILGEQISGLLEMARGNYDGTNNPREGLVFRPEAPRFTERGARVSFKVINNDFLLSGGD